LGVREKKKEICFTTIYYDGDGKEKRGKGKKSKSFRLSPKEKEKEKKRGFTPGRKRRTESPASNREKRREH